MAVSKIDELEAESVAQDVISRHSITALPVCPFVIAEANNITVVAKDDPTPGVSGFLMRHGDAFGIMYANHIRNDGFIRFTVAHELGHYFLPGHVEALVPTSGSVHKSRSGFVDSTPHERQADCFASALIMPESLFVPALQAAEPGFAGIQELSRTCNTSITATAIRYAKFCDERVAVILSSGRQIEWCFMSDSLRVLRGLTWIKKGDFLTPLTTTAKFNAVSSNVSSARERGGYTSLDDWFDGAPQLSMKEDVIGLGSYGKTLTVLFPDESVDDDFDEDEDGEE